MKSLRMLFVIAAVLAIPVFSAGCHKGLSEDEKAKALQDSKTPVGTASKDDHSIKNE